jgi:hypothetical protein
MLRSFAVWPTTSLFLLTESQFASPAREDNKFWDRFFETALGPYGRPHQSLLEIHDFQTAYVMDQGGVQCGPGRGIPRDGQGRGNMYDGAEYDAFGKSRPLTRYTAGQFAVASLSPILAGMSRWECSITLTGCWHFGQNANSDFSKSLFYSIFVIPTVSFRSLING